MEGRAAFSAYLDHDLDGVTNHQTIAFNKPLYNSDASYDPSTGVFTAPYDGLYLFIYFIGELDFDTVTPLMRYSFDIGWLFQRYPSLGNDILNSPS